MSASPTDHEDKETIPQVIDVVKSLGKDSEPGVMTAKQKVELWKYHSNLVFKPGEAVVSLPSIPMFCAILLLSPRTWTFWMRPGLLFILEGSFVSQTLDLNGMAGVSFTFCCSIITVSRI